jgi:DNA polymerase-3 subunit alpha
LKYFYPKEFLAGILNDRIDKIEEISKYIMYMKEKNIDVLQPDINKSKEIFWVEGNGLRIGLGALRGVGQDAIERVIKEREENGLFKDFSDFVTRCAKYVNKRIVESLIYAGAFDCFGYTRSQFAAVYEDVMARVNARDKQSGGNQLSFFGMMGGLDEMAIEINYPDLPEYEMMEKLSKEKSVLGVYVSGHPFEKFLPYFKDCTFNCGKLAEVTEDEETGEKTYADVEDGQPVTMGGMISAYKKLQTRSGSFMAFVTVEDMLGSVECVCFPKIYDKIKSFLAPDVVVSVSGKISVTDDKAPSIIVDKMTEFTIEEPSGDTKPVQREGGSFTPKTGVKPVAQEKEDKDKTLWLNISALDDGDVDELMETLCFYAGETKVIFVRDGKKLLCSQKIAPSRALFAELSGFLNEKCIKLL